MPSMGRSRAEDYLFTQSLARMEDNVLIAGIEVPRELIENHGAIPSEFLGGVVMQEEHHPVITACDMSYICPTKPIDLITEEEAVDFLKKKGYAVYKKVMETE